MTESDAGAGLGPADDDPEYDRDNESDVDLEDEPDDVTSGPIPDDVGDTDRAEVPEEGDD